MIWNQLQGNDGNITLWKNGKLDGVKIIIPGAFEDYRGVFTETYDSEKYKEIIGDVVFVQDDISTSKKNVLRGFHGNYKTSKLVNVIYGSAYSIIADNRPQSPTYKQWESYVLSGQNRMQLYLPAGIGNSAYALDDITIYQYKQNTHFEPNTQFTILWNDQDWNFWWPVSNPVLSERDYYGKYVN